MGSSALTLFATHGSVEQAWTQPLADRVKVANFSYDASLIATTGTYDRLVKIWRRLSYEGPNFDYSYLPHPALVTSMHWRKPWHREQVIDNVLYTVCADNRLRVWAPSNDYGSAVLKLWTEIDLRESIAPRISPERTGSQRRYAFVIDSRDFSVATEKAVQQASNDEQEQSALAHLIEVANRSPEVCVVLDDMGNMSAWGLESVNFKNRKPGDVFNVAHVDGIRIEWARNIEDGEQNVQFYNFCGDNGALTLLAHHFDGRIEVLQGRVDKLFDPHPQRQRLRLQGTWTGHSRPINKAIRTARGRALVTRSETNETIVWTQAQMQDQSSLARKSRLQATDHIHRMVILREGQFVVLLHHDRISVWDSRASKAIEVAQRAYALSAKPLCLVIIPEVDSRSDVHHLATIGSDMRGRGWELRLSSSIAAAAVHGDGSLTSLEDFGQFELRSGDDLAYVVGVDPAGTAPVISGFLDIFARDVAMSYTHAGQLKTWTARVNQASRSLDWLQTSTVETAIEDPSLASATSIRKAAVIDKERTLLTIWNTTSGLLEYEEQFDEYGDVQDLDWSSTPDNQSILAVGFPYRVAIYAQLRYDYFDAGPAWAAVREIRIRELTTHPIGDSVWLSNGSFVIGAGNQLFIQDNKAGDDSDLVSNLRLTPEQASSLDLFTLVRRLNGSLPVYHPQFLSQCILSGKIALVQRILTTLFKKLKFYTEGDELDPTLALPIDEFLDEGEVTVIS